MTVGILVGLAVLGIIAAAVLMVVRRDGLDLSPRGFLRGYLYVASLAGVITFALGVASLANWALASAFGDQLIYGGQSRVALAPRCPPGAPGCVEPSAAELTRIGQQQQLERERRRAEDLLRGLTSTIFGAAFWAAHWAARRNLVVNEIGSALRRGYLMLGTAVFGIATVALVPTGIYQLLSHAVLPLGEGTFRPGADALGGAIAVVPIWLLYLRLIVSEFREAPAHA